MNFLSKIFHRKPELFIKRVSKEKISGTEIEDIFKEKISGIIIPNFFSFDIEINIDFNSFKKKAIPFGFSTGISIFNAKANLEDYLAENKIYNSKIDESLSEIGYKNKLEDLLRAVFNNKLTQVFKNDKNEEYKTSTFRVVEPNKTGFQKHIGNEFMFNFIQTKDIRYKVITKTQLSFFLVLQEPEEGGELVLFDKRWNETPKEITKSGALINNIDERNQFLKGVKELNIKLKKGDLIIFDGGRIWHKVNPVKGSRNRITIGGFLAIKKNKELLYYWS